MKVAILLSACAVILAISVQSADARPGYSCNPRAGHGRSGCHRVTVAPKPHLKPKPKPQPESEPTTASVMPTPGVSSGFPTLTPIPYIAAPPQPWYIALWESIARWLK